MSQIESDLMQELQDVLLSNSVSFRLVLVHSCSAIEINFAKLVASFPCSFSSNLYSNSSTL